MQLESKVVNSKRTLSTEVGVRNGGQNQANYKELNRDHFNNQAVTAILEHPDVWCTLGEEICRKG